MKKLFLMLCSLACACGFAAETAQNAAAPAGTDPFFAATIKHVDVGGEFLFYQNAAMPMKMCDTMISFMGKAAGQRDPRVSPFFDITAKLLDLKSLKAQAASSVQAGKRLYVCKQFVFIAPDTKSVLADKAWPNVQLDGIMRSLPADTRIAIYVNVNSAYVWARINEEFVASGNKKYIDGLAKLKTMFKSEGVDLDALAASASGPMLLVVTGKNPMALKIAVAIADKDGVLSARLRKSFPPKAGESTFPITDMPVFPKSQLVYSEGCLLFATDPAILAKPAKMLGDVPRHAEYLSQLPKEGNSFVFVDIPPKFAGTINSMIPVEYRQMFRMRPFTLAAVGTGYPDGMGSVIVSSFSLQQAYYGIMNKMLANAMTLAPAAPTAAPAAPAPAPAPAK